MRRMLAATAAFLLLLSLPSSAEDPGSLIESGNALLKQGKYSKAIEDLQWAIREIRKLQADELMKFLPESVAGYEAFDDEADAAAAAILNISLIETGRRFEAKDGDEAVTVKIMAGEMGGTGLGAMMKMAQMYGTQDGELVRIKGYKCTIEWEDGADNGTLTVVLDNDIQVTIEISQGKKDNLRKFVELVDLDGLESVSN